MGAFHTNVTLLRARLPFQSWRHSSIARVLGLPAWTVGVGYRYLDEAEAILAAPARAEFVSTP